MNNITVGPADDSRIAELFSIAASIEPMFPDATQRLRAIALTLPAPGDECVDCGYHHQFEVCP